MIVLGGICNLHGFAGTSGQIRPYKFLAEKKAAPGFSLLVLVTSTNLKNFVIRLGKEFSISVRFLVNLSELFHNYAVVSGGIMSSRHIGLP